MDLSTSDWIGIATIVSTIVAIAALVFTAYEIRLMKRAEIQNTKALVSVIYRKGTTRGRASVFICFENHGRVPASNITLRFLNEQKWHHVANPDRYPFNTQQGISVLFPGQKLEYFVGQQTYLKHLSQGSVTAELEYLDSVIGRSSSKLQLSLIDQTFVAA